jgi:CDGSH-type Zn-finger protein
MTDTPEIAQKGPYGVEVEAGKTYFWCACGRSKTQPFCDQSHKATTIRPLKYVAEKTGKVWFCGCKRSGHKPLCDSTHKTL